MPFPMPYPDSTSSDRKRHLKSDPDNVTTGVPTITALALRSPLRSQARITRALQGRIIPGQRRCSTYATIEATSCHIASGRPVCPRSNKFSSRENPTENMYAIKILREAKHSESESLRSRKRTRLQLALKNKRAGQRELPRSDGEEGPCARPKKALVREKKTGGPSFQNPKNKYAK